MEGDCRAPWLPSPPPLSAAILESNDEGGGGRPESSRLGYKEPLCKSNGTPLSAVTHSQHPGPALPAQQAPPIPIAL